MMTVSEDIFREMDFFAVSFVLGIVLVLIYDCLRILRRLIRHGVIWISLEDLCYWVFTAFVIFAMLYQKNDGLIRGFSIGGIVLGMFLYNQFISGYTVKYIAHVLKKIIRFLQKICRFILTPFRKAANKIANKGSILAGKGRKFKKYLNKRLKRAGKLIKIGLRKK